MNHIELFAGCGGLSLGLEQAGFELLLANELSPMASETFAYNFFNENLSQLADNKLLPEHTVWLSSQYSDLQRRLRENPFEYPELHTGESDIPKDFNELRGKLIVGNIIQFNHLLSEDKLLRDNLRSGFGLEGVDLISGGPPCQSFSLAGLRKKDCEKNTLPWEFAKFVEHLQPRIVILENVTGILRAFKEDGVSYHAWFEVAKTFVGKGYVPLCLHINARHAGVAQNRPRFIMMALRHDIFCELEVSFNKSEHLLFKESSKLFNQIKRQKSSPSYGDFKYFDSQKDTDAELLSNSFLAPLLQGQEVSVRDAIHDLRLHTAGRPSDFVKSLNNTFQNLPKRKNKLLNHEPRSNSPKIQRRFRIYQVLQQSNKKTIKEVNLVLKGDSDNISDDTWETLRNFTYISDKGCDITFDSCYEFIKYLQQHLTKKQTQKALNPSSPAPTALSIPDDACHYDPLELRTLTVREMARIQSFPDSFVFRSKVTTGGKMRRFEVPQYTQVGNAVPPLFGKALGHSVSELLNRLKK